MDKNIRNKINSQIYQAFKKLGAGPDLLSIIGSYGDTLDDSEILSLLTEWNAGRPTLYTNTTETKQ